MAKNATAARDYAYWSIFRNVQAKHPEYTVAQLHAVTTAIRTRGSQARAPERAVAAD